MCERLSYFFDTILGEILIKKYYQAYNRIFFDCFYILHTDYTVESMQLLFYLLPIVIYSLEYYVMRTLKIKHFLLKCQDLKIGDFCYA